MTTIAIFSPGAMGSGLGRAWAQGGARVVTTVAGRSTRTRQLAAGLELLDDLSELVRQADIVVNIGPPGQAAVMADEIADCCEAAGCQPLVADLNAIAPKTVAAIAERLGAAGCGLVDGAISGPPPGSSIPTRLYLSGPSAGVLAALPCPGLTAYLVGPHVGSASAVKTCTSSVYKGFTALLLQAFQTADAHGVSEQVAADLELWFGDVMHDAANRIAVGVAKSGRYLAEMHEIAETQGAAGAHSALFHAMAEVYELAGRSQLASHTPEEAAKIVDMASVLAELRH